MEQRNRVRLLAGTGLLSALVVVLQFISNYIKIGPFSITLALIPIVIGAILYGRFVGFFLGAALGGFILITGGGEPFFSLKPFATIILCIFKTGLAGYFAGWIYILLKKTKENVAIVVSALSVPVFNTGLFLLGALTIFLDTVKTWVPEGSTLGAFVITGFVGFNFLIEFLTTAILSSAIIYVIKVIKSRHQH